MSLDPRGGHPPFFSRRRPASWLAVLSAPLLAALVAGCGGGDRPPARQGKAGSPAGTPGHRAPAPVPVSVVTVTRGTIASWYRATASLEAEKEAVVPARVAGTVDSLLCEEGDLVRAGQLLLTLENAEYRYRLEQAQAATANLRARFHRLEQMLKDNLVSDEEFMAAKSDYERAVADEGLARLNLSYTRVRAPFAGQVTARHVDVGQYVTPGTELVAVADIHPLLARVHVPAREFRGLKPGQAVSLVLDSSGEHLTGRIRLVSPVIDSRTGTIKVTVAVDGYPPDTRPGDFAQVRIRTAEHPDALLVPRPAVFTDRGEQVVYVVAGGRAARHAVQLGFLDDDHAEVLAGVTEGDSVVTRGQRSLKPGVPVHVVGAATLDSLLGGGPGAGATGDSLPAAPAGRRSGKHPGKRSGTRPGKHPGRGDR